MALNTALEQSPQHYKQIWIFIQQDLKIKLGESVFNNWIRKIQLAEYANNCIILSVATIFMRDWIKHNYLNVISDLWKHYDENIQHTDLIISGNINANILQQENYGLNNKNIRVIKELKPQEKQSGIIQTHGDGQQYVDVKIAEEQEIFSSYLDPRFTFSNFIIGPSNELAYSAALNVARSKRAVAESNPLFLYGGVGLGKTHLMHSIAWHIKNNCQDRKVIYMSAEKFMNQFIKSLRNRDIMSFKEQFRSVDVLMIDDIQFICGKESTQEEFFHTFNALIDNNRQIVISCDRSPSDLNNIGDRIRSRLGWGLVADVHKTSYELRLGILQSKTELLNVNIPDNVIEFLANNITSNIRELEGALNKVVAHSAFTSKLITLENTKDILKDLLKPKNKIITIDEIQKVVSHKYNIKIQDFFSESRVQNLARPRQIAMYFTKKFTSKSLIEISKIFKRKDHTTVLHAIKKIDTLSKIDPAFNQELQALLNILQY